jgi:hypothetical protein
MGISWEIKDTFFGTSWDYTDRIKRLQWLFTQQEWESMVNSPTCIKKILVFNGTILEIWREYRQQYGDNILVGGFNPPLKNIKVSCSPFPNIWKKMFQTTNQHLMEY